MSSNANPPEWNAPTPPSGNQPYPAAQPYPGQPYPAAQPYPSQPYADQPPYPSRPDPPQPATPGYPAPYGDGQAWLPPTAPPPVRRRRRTMLLVAAGVVVVLAVGGVTGWRALAGAPKLTYQGKTVTDPMAAIKQAESTVFDLTSKQPSTIGADDHCYYAVPNGGPSAHRHAVDQGIYCGPMAFLDSPNGDNFLHFTVQSTAAGSHVRLSAADNPETSTTERLPAGFDLVRPGSSAKHATFAAVATPTAPHGTTDAFVSDTNVGPAKDLLFSKSGNYMFGLDGGVELFSLASVPYAGKGATARSAAPGQRLLAFVVNYVGASDSTIKDLDLGVVVGSQPERKVPDLDHLDNYKVISVPSDATKVSLVLKSEGTSQTLSLLDGSRGKEDIDVTTRYHYGQLLNVTKDLPMVVSDNGQTENTTMHLTVKSVHLEYFEHLDAGKWVTPADPTTAYLHIALSYTIDADPDHTTYQELGSPDVELTDAAGSHYLTKDLITGGDSNLAYEVFTVPASFTDGQLVFGAGTESYGDGTTELITPSFTIPVHIPAG